MFGYVRPLKPEMKFKEFDAYKAVYCGLCHTLKKEYGFFARFFLSYDLVFLALLHLSLNSSDIQRATEKRCAAHPFKKRACFESAPALSFAAAELVILTYFKLMDDIADGGAIKKTAAALAVPAAKKYLKKAKKQFPILFEIAKEGIERQMEAEHSGTGADQAAYPFARLIGETAAMIPVSEKSRENREKLYAFGFALGRFIYLLDAADDLERDMKSGNFNPFSGCSKPEIEGALRLNLGQLGEAFQNLELCRFKEILANVIYFGLPAAVCRLGLQKQSDESQFNEKITTD